MSDLEALTEMSTPMVPRILVIDSDQPILELFQLILEPEGHEIRLFLLLCGAIPGLEQIAGSFIILGSEFRQHPQRKHLFLHAIGHATPWHIPFVACTTELPKTFGQNVLFCQEDMPSHSKPFDSDQLLEGVHHLLPPSLEGESLLQSIEQRR